MNVPLLDLKAQYQSIKPELDDAIMRVVESQICILGPEVETMEREMAEYLGASFALGVSSGTDALLLALMTLGIGPGDEVIVPTFSFFATAGVVARLGATPVFADIDPRSYNIAPAEISRVLSERTAAIIPVHLFGQSAEMEEIVAIGREHAIPIVEDAAQAFGAVDEQGRSLGTIGDVGCYSFFPSKNLGAMGDAGLVVTNDVELSEAMRIRRVHGGRVNYVHEVIGGNFRLDALQAAVLRVKLPHLRRWSEARRANADDFRTLFLQAGLASGDGGPFPTAEHPIALPIDVRAGSGGLTHIYNQYVVRAADRDRLAAHLRERSIGNAIYYPIPFHRQDCFADLTIDRSRFPVADRAAAEVLALPIYPEMSHGQRTRVVEEIAAFYRS